MYTLAESFSLILAGLRATIAQIAFNQRDRTEFLVFVHGRIGRTIQRFQQLYARWKNGSLPRPRIRAPRPAAARKRNPAKFRLPRGRAWLRRQLQHFEANGRASQFRHLLATSPELAEFLQAAPQARRLLNPVCQMLGVTLPAALPPVPKPAEPALPSRAPHPTNSPGHPAHPAAAPTPRPFFSSA